MTTGEPAVLTATCYHCGEDCADTLIEHDEKTFCCQGCRTVYDILNRKGLCDYYVISQSPGTNQRIRVREGKFAFLDHPEVAGKLVEFASGNEKHVTFYLPQMHCASCIWLLEHLSRIDKGVISSRVNFPRKEVTVVFDAAELPLSKVATLLADVGYEPHVSLRDVQDRGQKTYNKARLYRIGVAGFCFGNIMLFSFPEYLGMDREAGLLEKWFSALNLALSLPVFFYCAWGFFESAWKGLRQKFLNIDVPIAVAIIITFGRSVYEIVSDTGAGYMDSLAGIVFFMLVGRYLQDRTQESLAFDRDYTSYFPLGVSRLDDKGEESPIPVSEVRPGQRLRIHNHEIVPADGMLVLGKASIDYSFVTGESAPVEVNMGELVYAGGRQTGGAIEVEVVKEVSQSYLTRLWNDDAFGRRREKKKVSFIHHVSKVFTIVLFALVLITALYWSVNDPPRIWNAVTAMLIIACPCTLLLAATFTNGSMLAVLQRHRFHLKNASVIESLSDADTIVFDKTGTISLASGDTIAYEGAPLDAFARSAAFSLAAQSSHPMSRGIAAWLRDAERLNVKQYAEEAGRGSEGIVAGKTVRLGSASFSGVSQARAKTGEVYFSVNGEVKGCFRVRTRYRPGLSALIAALGGRYRLALLSGDNNAEEKKLRAIFGPEAELKFAQSPHEKLAYIRALQQQGREVIMVGDGLNDAGALQQGDAGIAVTDDVNNFTPGSDAILDGRSFALLARLLEYCRKSRVVIWTSFSLSILYNLGGLFFAVQGKLSPLVAAVIMPSMSVSIMLLTFAGTQWYGRRIKL